jgi:hypothetical protein
MCLELKTDGGGVDMPGFTGNNDIDSSFGSYWGTVISLGRVTLNKSE